MGGWPACATKRKRAPRRRAAGKRTAHKTQMHHTQTPAPTTRVHKGARTCVMATCFFQHILMIVAERMHNDSARRGKVLGHGGGTGSSAMH